MLNRKYVFFVSFTTGMDYLIERSSPVAAVALCFVNMSLKKWVYANIFLINFLKLRV